MLTTQQHLGRSGLTMGCSSRELRLRTRCWTIETPKTSQTTECGFRFTFSSRLNMAKRNRFHYCVTRINHAKLATRVGQVKYNSSLRHCQDTGDFRDSFAGRYPY